MQQRGAYVAFGNTAPALVAQVMGVQERGTPDIDGRFNSATGYGYIPATDGDYARALALGVHVELYNFETFGGFGKGVTCLLKELSATVMNKLTTAQYEETTWGARGWLAFQSQRLSVKLHLAVAYQILGQELGLAACRGADQRDDAC